jgi:arabinan endo-1,5-alpha-L-arabinosidase
MTLLCALLVVLSAPQAENTLSRDQIQIRDPFVLPVPEEQTYYLYGTGTPLGELGFDAYASKDLEHWEGPVPVLRPPEDFWGTQHFWAPEVHHYKGRYYLFGTFAKKDPLFRGTQIFVSDSPRGPFRPLGKQAHTPSDWLSLDGTLFVDDKNDPWMVFCHEWVQIKDGSMCAVRLRSDLTAPLGAPTLLFHASQAPWGKKPTGKSQQSFVTDGPWLHRLESGTLLMLWSSFGETGGYKVGVARSESGSILGPWTQDATPLFDGDGGHPMVFKTFDGRLMLALHSPNRSPERARFFPIAEEKDGLRVVPQEKQER